MRLLIQSDDGTVDTVLAPEEVEWIRESLSVMIDTYRDAGQPEHEDAVTLCGIVAKLTLTPEEMAQVIVDNHTHLTPEQRASLLKALQK